jgi:hypothetical protein
MIGRGMRTLIAFIIAVSALGAGVPDDAPPHGYTWHKIADLKVELLKPARWTVTESARNGVFRLEMTPPDDEVESSVEAIYRLEVRRQMSTGNAVEMAGKYVEKELASGSIMGEVAHLEVSTLKGVAGMVDCDRPIDKGGHYRRAVSAIGNSKTNTIYYMSFTASAADWDALWEEASYLMGQFHVDDDI